MSPYSSVQGELSDNDHIVHCFGLDNRLNDNFRKPAYSISNFIEKFHYPAGDGG